MTEFAPHHAEAKPAGWRSEETLLSVRARADPGGGGGGVWAIHLPPPAIFKHDCF